MNEDRDTNKELDSAPESRYRDEPQLENNQSAGGPQTDVNKVSRGHNDKLCVLFPNLPDDELDNVAETLHGYCAIVWRIYERLARERPELIDELMRNRRIMGKVDSSN